MAMRGPRQPIGSASWIAEERSSALQIAQSEVEEFSFSARNDVDWLNEHMAEIFSENQMYARLEPCLVVANETSPSIVSMLTICLFAETSPISSKHQENYAARRLEQRERRTRPRSEW